MTRARRAGFSLQHTTAARERPHGHDFDRDKTRMMDFSIVPVCFMPTIVVELVEGRIAVPKVAFTLFRDNAKRFLSASPSKFTAD